MFALFTYVRPFLETVTRVHGATISLILQAIGAAGFVGTVLIGRALQWGFYQTLIVIPLLMAATALALMAFGNRTVVVVALVVMWGLAGTSATVGWWAWIAKVFPQDAEAGGSLFVVVVQMSIALGSTVGGLLFEHSGYRAPCTNRHDRALQLGIWPNLHFWVKVCFCQELSIRTLVAQHSGLAAAVLVRLFWAATVSIPNIRIRTSAGE